eukprot:764655-Hanusia_phi.AAC.3
MARTTRNSQRTEVPDLPLEPMEPESTTSNEMVDDGVVDRPSLKEDVNADDEANEGHRPPSEPTQIEQERQSAPRVASRSTYLAPAMTSGPSLAPP